MEEAGLRFVGRDETGERMEIIELRGHPFYVAAQFHPEFKSRPFKPSPLFRGLLLAASGQLNTYMRGKGPAVVPSPVGSPLKGPPKAREY